MNAPRHLQLGLTVAGAPALGWVRTFALREALSEGFTGEVELEATAWPDLEALPGRDATLEIVPGNAEPTRRFTGVVHAASARHDGRGVITVKVALGDRAFPAALGCDRRIFQHQSVPDIVRAVLSDVGVAAKHQRWTLRGSYPARPYVVQGGEPDRDFVARLLADEGIAWAVWPTDDGDVLHFFDDPSAVEPIAGEADLVDRRATAGRSNTIRALRERLRGTSDAVCLRDYDPAHPALDLTATAEAPGTTGRAVYLHPGGFSSPSEGRARANRTLERLQCLGRVMEGESDAPQLVPGRWFTMHDHPRAALNTALLVVSVEHRGRTRDDACVYENRFTAIPKATPFRPQEAPTQPVVGGVEVAVVTGAEGQELWGSAAGEVRVKFPWDTAAATDDRSSTWLRVGQLALGGPMVIPRVGFEVLVDYSLGHLDRPYVSGHVYNGAQPPPYALPDQCVVSSLQTNTTDQAGGANELRFDDTAGLEQMFLNASRDLNVSVEHDSAWSVGANATCHVGANRTTRVGADHTAEVIGNRTVTVGGDQSVDAGADLGDGVGANLTLTVGAMRQVTVGGDHTEETAGALSRTVGALQCITGVAGYARVITGASSTTVGGVRALACARSLGTSCGGARTETVGALKMVRAKTVAIACGAAYAQQCAAQSARVGGDRTDSAAAIALNVGGGVKGKAADINLTGTTRVVLRVGGTTVEVTPAGVTFKSAKINLQGVKRLKSLQHKTD